MIRNTLIVLSLGSMVACGYSESQYADDYTAAMCDNITACETDIVDAYVAMGLDDATAQSTYDASYTAVCEPVATSDTGSTSTDSTCNFDSTAAKACVDGLAAMSCDFWSTGTGLPADCATVCG
ncbi:MAG: hypothetical protein GXP62_14010 [Oligoflexia bacterium]|nr:hypothetical protein [Oligoflexia bacterium]